MAAVAVAPHRTAGRVLFAASAVHVCNDAFFAIIYPLLPFIAEELRLSYADVGLVKSAFSVSSSILQLPAGILSEKVSEYALLAWGNAWVGAGIVGMAMAMTFPVLLIVTALAGIGGNVQHPVASAMVARAYEGGGRGTAIGTLNFAGDLGKMLAPVLIGFVTITYGWRATLIVLGVLGIIFSIGMILCQGWVQPPAPAIVARDEVASGASSPTPRAFWMLSFIGLLDASTRTGALTFLPFAFEDRGLDAAGIGILFGIIFGGGAAGKFLCGPLGDRFGPFAVVGFTELTTAAALVGLVWGPPELAWAMAVVFGFGLNGTSSVLYAAVASLVPEGKRGRGYGMYYTFTQLGGGVAAYVYGLSADWGGLQLTFVIMAALTAAIVPLAIPIRRRLHG
jgi:MFS family permease